MADQSGKLPTGTHINPQFSGGIHVNSNNHNQNDKSTAVHVNPKFIQEKSSNSVHVNPNFAKRALPRLPGSSSSPTKNTSLHINPTFLDGKKAKAFEEAIKMAVEGNKIHVNPNFKPKISPNSAKEKENIKTPAVGMKTPSAFSSATKTLFKKIGQRKLVRVKSNTKLTKSSQQQQTPKTSSFAKIGTRKLIRVSKNSPKPVRSSAKSAPAGPLSGTYKVKTDRKIVKKSPMFATPFSSRKRKRLLSSSPLTVKRPFSLSRVLNPFRVDRRPAAFATNSEKRKVLRKSLTPKHLNLKKTRTPERKAALASAVPRVTTQHKQQQDETPFTKKPVPPKPARKTPVRPAKPASTTLINVQGVRYSISENGRKLNRIQELQQRAQQRPQTIPEVAPKKLYLEGEEYVEDEPGVMIRSRNSMTRASITSAKQRSIHTIIKSQTRSKQYCMFFNKFGKCKKKEDGVCPYIHDPEKVAVCRKFLQGNCHKDQCLLSHKVAPEKMPVCKFYLEGVCTKEPCPYLHVKVNDAAEICADFVKGFCPLYDKCLKRHVDVGRNGKETEKSSSSSGDIPSISKKSSTAPAKPKRKSIGHTPMTAQNKKKPRTRYFEENEEETLKEKVEESKKACCTNDNQELNSSFEKKRQRLLKKVELAKQGWSGMGAVQDHPEKVTKRSEAAKKEFLDDSGPYEEIDEADFDEEEEEEQPKRPPVGRLPSFISLSGDANDLETTTNDENNDKEEEFEERLI